MKTVYRAANLTEADIVAGMLQRRGIDAEVGGRYLQTAVGAAAVHDFARFDNAHAVKSPKRGKFKGRIVTYDHLHQTPVDKGTPYTFSSAEQLLQDFFQRINQILNQVSKP